MQQRYRVACLAFAFKVLKPNVTSFNNTNKNNLQRLVVSASHVSMYIVQMILDN